MKRQLSRLRSEFESGSQKCARNRRPKRENHRARPLAAPPPANRPDSLLSARRQGPAEGDAGLTVASKRASITNNCSACPAGAPAPNGGERCE